MKRIKVRKVFNDCISLRDYIVDKAIKKNESLLIEFQGDEMFLGADDLKKGKKSGLKLRSNWGDMTYDLVDYPWKPNSLRLF